MGSSSSPVIRSEVVGGINLEVANRVPYVAGFGIVPGEGVDPEDRAALALHANDVLEVNLKVHDQAVKSSMSVRLDIDAEGRFTADVATLTTSGQMARTLDYLGAHTRDQTLAARLARAASRLRDEG